MNDRNQLRKKILEMVKDRRISSRDGLQLIKELPSDGLPETDNGLDIAIIGISGRFPGASDVDEFWENLLNGACSFKKMSELNRSGWKKFLGPFSREAEDSRWGAFLADIDRFDPHFFDISKKEAQMMDPRQRLFLQEAYLALENAGYSEGDLEELECGVFVGCQEGDYTKNFSGEMNPYIPTGNSNSVMAARISYFLNLRGPSVAVDTACSSALVAVHLACESIRGNTCAIAIAGSVLVLTTPLMFMGLNRLGIFSPTGECRVFDNEANGTVIGEAVGAVILKPLARAIADNDYIYGIIKGSDVNQDGKTSSITAPSALSQAALEEKVYRKFNISPETIGYVEAHGTGTKLGDPIEIQALTNAFRKFTGKTRFCAIGSVKSNIGHSMCAAGISSLIKTLGCLSYGKFMPSPGFEKTNEHIDFENSPFYVNTGLKDWDHNPKSPRRAAISSFGFNGTNCHIVVEEAPPDYRPTPAVDEWPAYLFLFSAKSEHSLFNMIDRFGSWLTRFGDRHFPGDISFTLAVGRSHFRYRMALTAVDVNDLKQKIAGISPDSKGDCCFWGLPYEKSNSADPTGIEIGRQSLDTLAELFSRGFRLDWGKLFHKAGFRKIPLPGYSFESKSYWCEDGTGSASKERLHPLLGRNVSSLDEVKFSTLFTGDEFFVKDHVVKGQTLFPGVAYLEMARAAGDIAGEKKVWGLKNVTWITPLAIAKESAEVILAITREHGRIRCDVTTGKGPNHLKSHFQAFLTFERGVQSAINIDAIKQRCGDALDGSECYRLFLDAGYQYGPTFRSIQKLYIRKTEALSYLRLPPEVGSDGRGMLLHPSILDGALQSIMGAVGSTRDAEGVQFLPFSLGELAILKPLEEECHVYIKLIENAAETESKVRKYEISITDRDGDVAVHMKNFTLRAFKSLDESQSYDIEEGAGPSEAADLSFCGFEWVEKDLASGRLAGSLDSSSGALVIFDHTDVLWEACFALIKPEFAPRIILVKKGEEFKKTNNQHFQINPERRDHFARLLTSLSEDNIFPARILYCWSMGNDRQCGGRIQAYFLQSLYPLTYLTQILMARSPKQPIILLNVQWGKTFDSAFSGFAKSIRAEHPKFIYKTVLVEEGNRPGEVDETKRNLVLNQLMKEYDDDEDMDIRFSAGRKRFVRQLVEMDCPGGGSDLAKRLRQDGVYLITGGLGGVGFHLARGMAAHCPVKLALNGRSSLSGEGAKKIAELKALGVEAVYIQGDVSRKEQVEAVLNETRRLFGKLTGIIHAAGVTNDSLCLNKTPEQMEEVLAPKILGTVYLDEATTGDELDFFVLFSSLAAVTGNRGQADYAFANGFMDYYASVAGERRGAAFLSVNWPVWREGGMNVDPAMERTIGRLSGLAPLPTKSGVEAFGRALSLNVPQVVILHGNREKIRQVFRIACPQVNEAVMEENLPGLLKLDVLKLAAAFVSFDGPLEIDRDIQEYGFDSVAITAFSNDINGLFGLDVTPAIFFELEDPTLESLIKYLCNEYRDVLEQHYRIHKPATPHPASDLPKEDMLADLVNMAANFVGFEGRLEGDRDIQEYGFDSVAITAFANEINGAYGLDITPAVFFELEEPTLRALANFLMNEFGEKFQSARRESPAPVDQSVSPADSLAMDNSVAIIGMSGIMPQSKDLDDFWKNLKEGRDLVTPAPEGRFAGQALPEGLVSSICGGFMLDIDKFDAEFFNISPREAKTMDPQQRLFLETVWKTVEDAGYRMSDLSGSKTALFIGISNSDYYEAMVKSGIHLDASAVIGHSTSIRANRVSFLFNFHGPSEPIDTACSSSLLAVHRGVEALRSGTCDQVIAGGSNAMISPTLFVTFQSAGMLSEDSRCRTFDKRANGYARGEGCGALFLKSLKRAELDGDHIYAVIKGTAENHGGHAKSLTSPNANAQAMVIVDAFDRAGIAPDTVSYIEAHGTGTNLGDPVEINGLKKAFAQLYKQHDEAMPDKAFCGIGSVKTNVGHLEAAAGISGIIKVLLSMKYEMLPATVHFEELNPFIDLNHTPFYIVDKTIPWNPLVDCDNKHIPRRAGISSFGYGGSNVHIILEEYREARDTGDGPPWSQVFVLSAKNGDRLVAYARSIADFLKARCGNITLTHDSEELDTVIIRLCGLAAGLLNMDVLDIDPQANLVELGIDPVRGALLVDTINEAFHKEIAAEVLLEYTSLEALAIHLSGNERKYSTTEKRSPQLLSARQVAYTLQVGREEMAERLAVVAVSLEEFLEALLGYVKGDADIPHLYRGNQNKRDSDEICSVRERGAASADFDEIAQLWVRGHTVDWKSLHPGVPPRRVSLPAYPFAGDRHWFDQLLGLVSDSPDSPVSVPQRITLKSIASPEPSSVAHRTINSDEPVVLSRRPIAEAKTSPIIRELPLRAPADDDFVPRLKEMLAAILMMPPEKVGVDKSFNELGMDSVLGVEFTRKLKKELQVDIKATRLYDYSTIAELANYLGALAGTTESPAQPSAAPLAPTLPGNNSLAEGIKELLAVVLMMPPEKIDVKKPFSELGMDSVLGVEFTRKLKQIYHIDIKATRLYDHSSVLELAAYLESSSPEPSPPELFQPTAAKTEVNTSDIAIIGMSGRYPGAETYAQLWDNLVNGLDAVREVPSGRWSVAEYYDPDPARAGKTYCKWGGFLDDIDKFDPLFFNISPAEAELLDPQQRLFMQEAWRAFEDAGYSAEDIDNCKCGVYVGVMSDEYPENMFNARSILAARISYFMNLKGPAVPIDTACSSSLVAIYLGSLSLIDRQLDLVLAGGVSLYLTVKPYIAMSKSGMLAKDGRCKTFDNNADGFVPGEGVGAVVLKLLDKALADNDHIYGVMKGIGINQDGRTNGITAPSARSQTELELEVYKRSGINPETISYVEAHGTGTKLGDPIEIEALTDSFRKYTSKTQFCPIGSIKTNIGHTSAAAGVASVIKVLLALKHGKIPPSLHYRRENEHLDLSASPFYVNTKLSHWNLNDRRPARAAVSSFGYSGTNAHMIIEAPPVQSSEGSRLEKPYYIIPLSARSYPVLTRIIENLSRWLDREGMNHWPGDIAYTLSCGRTHFNVRSALIVRDTEDLAATLHRVSAAEKIDTFFSGEKQGEDGVGEDYKEWLLELASQYTGEGVVDWKDLFSCGKYRRIPMPAYPFEKRRCWIEGFGNTKRNNPLAGNDRSTPTVKQVEVLLAGDEFFLVDNVVYGRKVLPGVAYLEMVRAAGETLLGRLVSKIKNLVWSNLITVDHGPSRIKVQLRPDGDGAEFEVREERQDGETAINCRGKIEFQTSDPMVGTEEIVDVESIKERCPGYLKGVECYDAYKTRRFVIGPSLQALLELRYNDTEALAHLKLHCSVEHSLNDYTLHPALMDPILQTVTGLMINTVQEPGRPYLSFALGETEILRPLAPECYVYARVSSNQVENSPVKKFSMVMVDLNGRPLIRMRDFCLKKAHQVSQREDTLPAKAGSADAAVMSLEAHSEFTSDFAIEVAGVVAAILKVDREEIDIVRPLLDYGFSSITMSEFVSRINKTYDIEFTIESFFDLKQPTIESLSKFLIDRFGGNLFRHFNSAPQKNTSCLEFTEASCDDCELEAVLSTAAGFSLSEPIAIIGMNGLFPQADNLEDFWNHIKEGRSLVRDIPERRKIPGFGNACKGGFLDEIDTFDADFFNISSHEASLMDPQQRIALEMVWKVVEDAGYKASTLAGSNAGVYFGFSPSGYGYVPGGDVGAANVFPVDPRLNHPAMTANRIANFLELHGPCEAVDTAGSSSLMALYRGMSAIRNGMCSMAIVGGINLLLYPWSIGGASTGVADGQESFFGEGGGAVLLKPLSEARRDKDHIYAVIDGIGVQYSGRTTENGFPSPESLEGLFVQVYENEGIDPASIGYVESGAAVAELRRLEIDALKVAFEKVSRKRNTPLPSDKFCGIGSLAENTGRLESAAGIAGIIKTVMSMNKNVLPPSSFSNNGCGEDHLKGTPFDTVSKAAAWQPRPFRSAVSAFGVGGSKVHVVLETFPRNSANGDSNKTGPQIFVLSARNRERLVDYARDLVKYLRQPDDSGGGSGAPLNIRKALKEIEGDILQLSDKLLRTNPDGFTTGSAEAFSGAVNRLFNLNINGEYFLKSASIGAFIQNLGRDYKESLLNYCKAKRRSSLRTGVDVTRLAYTLQAGREEMDERLAIVASGLEELFEKLSAFAMGQEISDHVFQGNVADNTRSFGFLLSGEQGVEAVKHFIRIQNFDHLANFWVLGGVVDWSLLYPGEIPGRMPVPTYPFCRQKYWLPERH